MTGRDLIIYILDNNLENEPVFKDGRFIGFMTVEEAAAKFSVGTATVKVWYKTKALNGVEIGDTILIFADQINPIFAQQAIDKIIV